MNGGGLFEPLVVDLDDFCEENQSLELLDDLRAATGGQFKASLFTIPGLSSHGWVDMVQHTRPWLELIPHGYLHKTSRECSSWTDESMRQYLNLIKAWNLSPGFKAPGWQLNDAVYYGLRAAGYWIADKVENRVHRPEMLPAYELDEPRKIHGHIGHMGGHNDNELSIISPFILERWRELLDRNGPDAKFAFASQELRFTGGRGVR